MGARWLLTVAVALGRRPRLWGTAVTQAWRLRRRGWWRTAPFLPLPDADYLRFRMVTAYGGDGRRLPDAADVVTYLDWCRAWPRIARRPG